MGLTNIDPRIGVAFNQRIRYYMNKMIDGILEKGVHDAGPFGFNAEYAGGTLILAMPFWHPAPDFSDRNAVTELIFLNLDGQSNSTIYGDFELTIENRDLVRRVYVLVKGETDYYKESVHGELDPIGSPS